MFNKSYTTLRGMLKPRDKGTGDPIKLKWIKGHYYYSASRIPDWSYDYDLLSQSVSHDRSCEEAKIPKNFCPCMEERTGLMPYFYFGHAELLFKMNSPDNLVSLGDDTKYDCVRQENKQMKH